MFETTNQLYNSLHNSIWLCLVPGGFPPPRHPQVHSPTKSLVSDHLPLKKGVERGMFHQQRRGVVVKVPDPKAVLLLPTVSWPQILHGLQIELFTQVRQATDQVSTWVMWDSPATKLPLGICCLTSHGNMLKSYWEWLIISYRIGFSTFLQIFETRNL